MGNGEWGMNSGCREEAHRRDAIHGVRLDDKGYADATASLRRGFAAIVDANYGVPLVMPVRGSSISFPIPNSPFHILLNNTAFITA